MSDATGGDPGRSGSRARWEPLLGRAIDGAIDVVGAVLSVIVVLLRARRSTALLLVGGVAAAGLVLRRRRTRS